MSAISGVSTLAAQPGAEVQQQQQVQAAKASQPASNDDGSKNAKATVQVNKTGLNLVA